MNYIFKNITLIFANLGIFPDSNIKLKNTSINYEEVEVRINGNKTYILRDGFYSELIKNEKIFIQYEKNGELHRDDDGNSAEITNCKDGKIIFEEYYQNRGCHRDNDKPAFINYKDGKIIRELYYQNGGCHRDDDKPADINYEDGKIIRELYYQNGKLHRDDDKPAFIKYKNGRIICELYYENGKHRKTFTA